jgi:transcriptional regulator with XRE-family HTH domain
MAAASSPEACFARALREERKEAGLTQEDLGLAIDIGPGEISILESGRRSPQLRTMRRLADGLGVPLSQIFERAEEFEAKGV